MKQINTNIKTNKVYMNKDNKYESQTIMQATFSTK